MTTTRPAKRMTMKQVTKQMALSWTSKMAVTTKAAVTTKKVVTTKRKRKRLIKLMTEIMMISAGMTKKVVTTKRKRKRLMKLMTKIMVISAGMTMGVGGTVWAVWTVDGGSAVRHGSPRTRNLSPKKRHWKRKPTPLSTQSRKAAKEF